MNFGWLTGTDPIWGTVLHTLAYVALVLWVLLRERDADESGWRDLRVWIVGLAAVQILLYWTF